MNQSTAESLTVDCRGLQCPAPILRLSEAARKRRGLGGTLTILATDADFPVDLDAWCRTAKARVLQIDQQDGVIRAEVRLADPAVGPSRTTVKSTKAELTAAAYESGEVAVRRTPTPPAAQPVQSDPAGGLDLCGMPLGAAIRALNATAASSPGQRVSISADAPDFDKRFIAWASAMDATVESMERSGARITALVLFASDGAAPTATPAPAALRAPVTTQLPATTPAPTALAAPAAVSAQPAFSSPEPEAAPREHRATLLVLHNDLEALLAALMVANASAAQGMAVEIYFSFWGIHLLRGRSSRAPRTNEKPSLLQRMMLWMVPKGGKQQLGKLHMGGLGTRILLGLMRKRNILALDQLVDSAASQGVRFRVCSMSMGLMGMRENDIVDIPNIDFAGVASFSEAASRSAVALVF
ncbi:MAG: DsrE/DsrF/DrsH-like family protein [Polyangiaceae bacterium]